MHRAATAKHFVELVLLSTLVNTDSVKGVWTEDQAIMFVQRLINSPLKGIVDDIGRQRNLPRRVGRLIAIAKEQINTAVDADDRDEVGMQRLINTLNDAVSRGLISTDFDPDDLKLN